jgi:hypothetical protein
MLPRESQRFAQLLVVSVLAIIALTGCAAASGGTSPAQYLQSLERAHKLDSRAVLVCTRSVGIPPAGTPTPKPLVAANSSLKFVRSLESSSYLAQTNNSTLKSSEQGYAAICLFTVKNYGKLEKLWSYGLQNGDGGFISPP